MAKLKKPEEDIQAIRCPFCNQDFDPHDILFCDEENFPVGDIHNYDPVHGSFLAGIIQFNKVEGANNQSAEVASRKKYYFHPWSGKNRGGKPFFEPLKTEKGNAGYPASITVYRKNGLTPQREMGRSQAAASAATAEEADEIGSIFQREQQPEDDGPRFAEDTTFTLRTKACPKCHCFLPDDVGDLPLYRITVLGSSRAGKTTYMTLAAHQLTSGIGLPRGLVNNCTISRDSKRFFDYLIKSMQIGKLEATTMDYRDKIQVVFPIVCTIKPHGEGGPFILAINDCPGEAMESTAYLDNFYALASMDSALMIIDPSQFMLDRAPQAQAYGAEWESGMQQPAQKTVCEVAFPSTLREFTQRLKDMKQLKHIAFTLAKLDLVYGTREHDRIRPGDYTHISQSDITQQHSDGVDMNWIDTLSIQVSDAITTRLGFLDYVNRIENVYIEKPGTQVKSFCCSTRSWNADSKSFIDPSQGLSDHVNVNLSGYRLLEPLLYLMAVEELLPQMNREEPEPELEPAETPGFFRRLFGGWKR